MVDSILTKVTAGERAGRVRVWDPATRFFHWTLLFLIISAYFTRNFSSDATLYWHRLNGYAIIVLILFRLLWGFVGSSTSRFASFLPTPRATIRYGMALLRRRPLHYLGHNPLGSLLIFAMLLAICAQAGTGLFTSDDSFAQGPMVDHVSERLVGKLSAFHAKGFWIILGLAVIHVFANLVYQFGFKDRLIDAMLIGTKPAAHFEDQAEASFVSSLRAITCLVISVTVVAVGVGLAGGSLFK